MVTSIAAMVLSGRGLKERPTISAEEPSFCKHSLCITTGQTLKDSRAHFSFMNELTKIDSVAGVSIYKTSGLPHAFIFGAGATIDADGDPDAYGPDDSGLDWTANGGTPGSDWWGGPTDGNGMPLVQKIYEPSPGMYVSGTAHTNPSYPETSQYRYITSGAIPFIVLPGNHSNGARLGDVCLCFNQRTSDNCYGIYADVGPSSHIGELSMRMAEALSLDNDPKTGGVDNGIVYLVFPGSIGKWVPPDQWWDTANSLMHEWGGLARLKTIIPQL